MTEFENCTVEVVSEAGDAPDFCCDDGDLKLEAASIRVVYFDDEGPVIFAGRESSPGHFELVCRSRPRTATLVRRDARTFEGSWEEHELRGSWRILLPPGAVG